MFLFGAGVEIVPRSLHSEQLPSTQKPAEAKEKRRGNRKKYKKIKNEKAQCETATHDTLATQKDGRKAREWDNLATGKFWQLKVDTNRGRSR